MHQTNHPSIHRLLCDAYGIYFHLANDLLFFFTDIKPECIVRSLEIFIMHGHSCESSSFYYAILCIHSSTYTTSNTTQLDGYVRIGIHHNILNRKPTTTIEEARKHFNQNVERNEEIVVVYRNLIVPISNKQST